MTTPASIFCPVPGFMPVSPGALTTHSCLSKSQASFPLFTLEGGGLGPLYPGLAAPTHCPPVPSL
jgi:hypothetical protein